MNIAPQEIRKSILQSLHERRSDDFVEPEKMLEVIGATEESLDTEIRYLEERGLLTVMGEYLGKRFLNFAGVKLSARGVDEVERGYPHVMPNTRHEHIAVKMTETARNNFFINSRINGQLNLAGHGNRFIGTDIHTASKEERISALKQDKKEIWYKEWWMVYLVYPLFVLVAGTLFLYFVFGIGDSSPSEKVIGSIVTKNQSGGTNVVVNDPVSLRTEEDFSASNLRNNFISSSSPQNETLRIVLKHYPVLGSVNIWWGAMSLTPADFRVIGKRIEVDFLKEQAAAIRSIKQGSNNESELSFVVTYIPDNSKD